MPLDVDIHTLAELVRADQGLDHANDLGPLFVDGRGIEVIDFDIGFRLNRMREWARILGKLARPQHAHVGDPLDRGRAHVGRELLIAEHRQPFLQAELEPVAAGHPVARPVVQIFVRDDRLDVGVVGVGRGLGIGQHVFGVEDVQPLVLHRAHVEIACRDNHEGVEIVFEAEFFLVPTHRLLQRLHDEIAAVLIARLDIDAQGDDAAGHRGEAVLDAGEVPGDQREQV